MIKRNALGQFLKGTHWREPKPLWNKVWLYLQYQIRGKSAQEIANQIGITENAVLFWLHKHGISRRSTSEVRKRKHWGASGPNNPMWGVSGKNHPNWQGGVTPERIKFYASMAWRRAAVIVWRRDKARCRRCQTKQVRLGPTLHIHHTAGFRVVSKRADPNYLALLCPPCHHFVHSRRNTKREFLV